MLSGCGSGGGSDGPKTARVSGTVTVQGKPLEGASVYFMSEKFSAFGKTNAEGHYELVQGAVPGDNKVYISKLELPPGVKLDPEAGIDLEQLKAAAAGAENDPSGKGPKIQGPKELVPEEFSNPQKSKLTFPVPAGGTTSADFRL
ncbi:hypothetical protein LBMAG52_35210 [Planctomycetia bacterium]|nr:hypothetical protein LBMAG52_35210 [Planctomycetia bacterium]